MEHRLNMRSVMVPGERADDDPAVTERRADGGLELACDRRVRFTHCIAATIEPAVLCLHPPVAHGNDPIRSVLNLGYPARRERFVILAGIAVL